MTTQTANILGISRVSINSIYGLIRQRIAWHCEKQSPYKGEMEKYIQKSFLMLQKLPCKQLLEGR